MLISIVHVMARFTKSVDFNSYWLNIGSQRYEKQTAGLVNRDTKRMEQMMKRYLSNGYYQIAIIKFSCKFVCMCN